MEWRGVNPGTLDASVRNGNNGMDILFTAIERERRNSAGASNSIVMPHSQNTQSESRNGSSHQRVDAHHVKSNIDTRRHMPAPVSSTEVTNGFPMDVYAHSPLFFPFFHSQLLSQTRFRQPVPNAGIPPILPPVRPSQVVGDSLEMACYVCGMMYKTIAELHDHIVNKHLPGGFEQAATKAHHDSEERETKDLLPPLNGSHRISQIKKMKTHASASSAVDSKISSDVPLPTPKFSFPNVMDAGQGNKTMNSQPIVVADVANANLNANFPTFPMSPSIKNVPFSPLNNPYGLLNPLLAYQNLINVNGVCSSGAIPSALPQGMNFSTGGYPFLRYPGPPGVNYNFSNRLPFVPGMGLIVPTSSSAPSTTKASEARQYETPPAPKGIPAIPVPSAEEDLSHPDHQISSRHADNLRRRLSVPLISLNKEFRVPHPYNRISKFGTNTPCRKVMGGNECGSETISKYKDTSRAEMLNRKRRSVVEKPSSSRLNAKTIEQHISKLISNNEKVLLNPVLERVKPRRVFRRNSLDPASLTSYAAGITSRNLVDASYFKDDEGLKRSEKFSLKQCSTPPALGQLPSSEDHFSYQHVTGMTNAEKEKMIQLTRVPQARSQSASTSDDTEGTSSTNDSHRRQQINKKEKNNFHERRDSSSDNYQPTIKKARRMTFFECTDCGVRYRKEENYQIHKKIYCKYKKDREPHQKSAYIPQFSADQVPRAAALGPNFNLTRFTIPPLLGSTLPNTATNMLDESLKTSTRVHENAFLEAHSSQEYQKLVSSHVSTSASSEISMHNELNCTKMADAELHLRSMSPQRHGTGSSVKEHISVTNADASFSQRLSSTLDMTQMNTTTASVGPMSSIPKNKLPPNKRHLMRHFEEGNSSSGSPQYDRKILTTTTTTSLKSSMVNQSKESLVETRLSEYYTKESVEVPYLPALPTVKDSSNIATYDENLVPRSNYKLLLHQISLRNMQDMGILNYANLSPDKSIWSWQQMQKGILHPDPQEKNRRKSTESAPTTAQPLYQRKFSVPSRLFQQREVNQMSTGLYTSNQGKSSAASCSTERKLLVSSRKTSESSSRETAKHRFIPPLSSPHLKESVTKNSPLISNSAQVTAAVSSNPLSERFPETKSYVEMSHTAEACYSSAPKNLSKTEDSHDKGSSELAEDSDGSSATDKCDHIRSLSTVSNVNLNIVWSQNAICGRNSEVTTSQAQRMTTMLYPHMQPSLTARPNVSYCCLINPQPTCMAIPKEKGSEAKQVSMYSDWEISKPIDIPEELTIIDILTGWRLLKKGYRKGVYVMVESKSGMIMTDHKTYEAKKIEAVSIKKNSKQELRKSSFPTNNESVRLSSEYKLFTLPVQVASRLFKPVWKPVYASCHCLRATDTANQVASDSIVPGSLQLTVESSDPSTTTTTTAKIFSVPELNDEITSEKNSNPLASQCSKSETNCVGASAKDNLTDDDNNSVDDEILSDEVDRSSGRPSDSDTDSSLRVTYSLKVRRRKTRRERSAVSPREQRRALHCQTPPSPTSQSSVLPVHQSDACTSATEEKLRGCALCSIKAGRTDLITDTITTCQPCLDAAKKNNKVFNSLVPKLTLPSNMSKSNLPSDSLQYMTPPCSSSGYLDKSRASGNTQHWVSKTTPELSEASSSQSIHFLYPSPQSIKCASSECATETTTSSVNSSPAANDSSLRRNSQASLQIDITKATTNHQLHESTPGVVSPSLAEVVSEVMRTAAIQSKRHNKSSNSHQLLSHSRALVPGKCQYVIPLTESPPKPSGNEPIPCTESSTAVSTRLTSTTTAVALYSPKNSHSIEHEKSNPSSSKPYDITVTPATPPPLTSSSRCDSREAANNGSLSPSPSYDLPKSIGKLGHRTLALSSRESELFLNKANTLQSKGNCEDFRGENDHTKCHTEDATCVEENGHASGYHGVSSCESEEDEMKDEVEDSKSTDGAARPYTCNECKVAFRIGGHLAKHLRSKGHMVAMQKKTLNLLRMRQIPRATGDIDELIDGSAEYRAALNGKVTLTARRQNKTVEILDGTEGLARAQVRALFEGSGEYACVPNATCDDLLDGELGEDLVGSQDPRPFKCIACKVAFRFQGHLDRHFRSNLHLIAVGQYEQDAVVTTTKNSLQAVSSENINQSNDGNSSELVENRNSVVGDETEISKHLTGQNSEIVRKSSFVGSPRAQPITMQLPQSRDGREFTIDEETHTGTSVCANSSNNLTISNSIPVGFLPPQNGFLRHPYSLASSCASRDELKRRASHDENLSNAPNPPKRSFYGDRHTLNNVVNAEGRKSDLSRPYEDRLSYTPAETGVNQFSERRGPSHARSRSQPDSSIALRSNECVTRNVIIPCQVSCT
ncbi:unnamed protein product [Clavelina lepadiformis]|uniref:C2H2-type domain-containing protein n=1 Tax=Clavelina lepadiformis TaxID=159417 RepID=A0ABP0FUS4_CLALP